MKILILKNKLAEGVGVVERAVGTTEKLPSLQHIYLRTADAGLTITATNLELAIQATLTGKILEHGECSIPASVFAPIVRNLTSERVTLESANRVLSIVTDNYEAKIPGGDPKDFPLLPEVSEGAISVSISVGTLRRALASVVGAAQYSEVRPEISGVLFRVHDNKLFLVATDSFRLAEYVVPETAFESPVDVQVIIPLRTAEEILRVFGDDEERLFISIDEHQVLYATPTRRIVSRSVDGVYPEYRTIIPTEVGTKVSVIRQEFIAATKLVSSLAGRANDIMVTVEEKGRCLELSSGEGSLGENRYRIPAKIHGDAFSAVFNWKFLFEGLRIYQGAEVGLGVKKGGPALITSASEPFVRYVVMPIRS